MSKAKAKTIQILLDEGTLDGIVCMVASSWSSGELYSAPREAAEKLINTDACSKYGVYLLLSEERVYVGQSSDLASRIKQHLIGKDWWEQVVVLTTADDSFDRSDIDYLESVFIEKAQDNPLFSCDNKNKGNPRKIDRFKTVTLEQYLEEALFLMELIGIAAFWDSEKYEKTKRTLLPKLSDSSYSQREIRSKGKAKEHLEEQGYVFNNYWNYGSLQESTGIFWINPQSYAATVDWELVLNNHETNELIIIRIPANTTTVNDMHSIHTLKTRTDKPDLIDLKIDKDTLVDKASGYDFSKHLVTRFSY